MDVIELVGAAAIPVAVIGLIAYIPISAVTTKRNRNRQIADFKSNGFTPTVYEEVMNGDAFVADVEKKKIMILRRKPNNSRTFDFSDIRSVSLEERSGKGGTYTHLRITIRDVNDPLHTLTCYGRTGLKLYAKIEAAGIV